MSAARGEMARRTFALGAHPIFPSERRAAPSIPFPVPSFLPSFGRFRSFFSDAIPSLLAEVATGEAEGRIGDH